MAGDPMIVAGFGFRAAATADSLRDAYVRAGGTAKAVATAADKAQAAAFQDFAARVALPVYAIAPEVLVKQQTLTSSEASREARHTGSVSEAAALAAAGPGGRLITPRVVSADGMATCALAKGSIR